MEGGRVHPQPQQRPGSERTRLGVYHNVLRRLRDAAVPEALAPDFADSLWAHFHRFSVRCEFSRSDHLMLLRWLHSTSGGSMEIFAAPEYVPFSS